MLGFRACRLGLFYPEIYEMQVRAIVRAAQAVQERSGDAPLVEIMHPLVGFGEELRRLRELTVRTAGGGGWRRRVPRGDDDRAAACVRARGRDRRARRLLLLRHERPDADGARALARRRGPLPAALPRAGDPRARPVRDDRPGRRRRPDADRGRARPVGAAGHQARDLRRARRRGGERRLLPRARARLRDRARRTASRSRGSPRRRPRWPRAARARTRPPAADSFPCSSPRGRCHDAVEQRMSAAATPRGTLAADGELLERSADLAELAARLDDVVRSGRGRLAFVSGEAGVGKTALLRRFCAGERRARVLWGACDALFTPRALGPFARHRRSTGGELRAARRARRAAPGRSRGALLDELRTQTADDRRARGSALGRRGDARRAPPGAAGGSRRRRRSSSASFRDDALERFHPLRVVLGELADGAARAPGSQLLAALASRRSRSSPRRTASTPTSSTR